MPEVVINTQDPGATATTALADAWVYWREAGALTLLRTGSDGRLRALRPSAERTHPWEYTARYNATAGAQVDLLFSRGTRPIPDAQLNNHANAFHRRTVPAGAAVGGGAAPVAPNNTNTLVVPSVLTLPNLLLTIAAPSELTIWPLLWELSSDAYHTDGLSQSGALWTSTTGSGSLTTAENGPAPAPSAAVRPRERGLKAAGTIDARATGVTLRVLDAAGNLLQLRPSIAATTAVQEIAGTLGTVSGNSRPYQGSVFLADAGNAFGPVQILVESQGIAPPILEAFAVCLSGFQIALVDDHSTNPNGQQPGPVLGEADEVVIVDFLNSPQATLPAISAETRARRMVQYRLKSRNRALSATNPAIVEKPEMPLWMAEFQALGLTKSTLEDLMLRRKRQLPGTPTTLRLGLEWRLELSWDGPDVATASPRLYSYSQSFTQNQDGTLTLAASNQLDAVGSNGQVANALNPTPAAVPFPTTGRRSGQMFVSGQNRAWGRAAATSKEAMLIEWQPAIVGGGDEILRGGNGRVELASVSIDGTRIDGGLVPSGGSLIPPPATDPDLRLPLFRVRGSNPITLPANDLIDALVAEHFNANNTAARIALLSLVCWQETTRRILAHEAGRQFEHRGAGRRGFGSQTYGHEQDMPYFGAPHGYGYGQHDNPPVTDDGSWSFFENIKESVRRIMDDKATVAFNHISGHLPTPPDQRIRAVYQREIVRRYNGGEEFQWSGTDWEINPSLARWEDAANHAKGPNQRLPYPNRVLGTTVVYFTGAGAATVFPWPIAFAVANFGPGT